MTRKPFEGVKIVQLCWAGVGVYTLNYLSHYGATTIRVETATRPDPVRLFARSPPRTKKMSRSDWSAALFSPLRIPRPNSVLASTSSSRKPSKYLEDLWPGRTSSVKGSPRVSWTNSGWTTRDLREVNPEIIMFRTCGYGHTGPMATSPASAAS